MSHYDFTRQFASLYDKAVALYRKGQRGAETFFDKADASWLVANGLTSQNLYDYAEDEVGGAEPGLGHALTIETVRRDFFLNVQKGVPSKAVLDEAAMPGEVRGRRGHRVASPADPKGEGETPGRAPGEPHVLLRRRPALLQGP